MEFLRIKGAIIQLEEGTIRPRARTDLLNAGDDEIVRTYNSEIRGILNFYSLAENYYKLSYFQYLMEWSCLSTLAKKHNVSAKQIRQKYRQGKSWSVPYTTKAGNKRIGILTVKDCKYGMMFTDQIHEYKPYKRKELWSRIAKNECECCGTKSELHCRVFTIRRLKDLGTEPWAELMRSMRRKTLIVCPACYNLIHSSHGIK
jgi:hypothetical protein